MDTNDKGVEEISIKIKIPVHENPDKNFIGLIIGPRGRTQKNMEISSGATIKVIGGGRNTNNPNEEFYVLITATSQASLNKAQEEINKLIN